MVYVCACMAMGTGMLSCGIEENSTALVMLGVAMYCASFVVGQIVEDRLIKRIEELEKRR